MQRLTPVLLIVALLCGGAAIYWKHDDLMAYYQKYAPAGAPGKTDTGAENQPAPTPQRFTRVPPPSPTGEKQFAPPGTFYVLKRKKVVSRVGIQAVNPGELVHLLERLPDGKLRVTVDNADFTMLASEVTDDVDLAREAERKYLESPPAGL